MSARASRRCYSAMPTERAVTLGHVTNAEIAAALDELGVLYELDGAVKYRVLAYSTAATAIRESPVSVAELARAGPGDRDPRRRQDAGGKDRRPAGDRRDPRRGEAEGEVPADPDRGDAGPGARGENRAPALRRARGRHARGPEGGGRGRTDPRASKGLGPKAEENVLASLERLGEPGEGPGRLLLSKVRPIAEELAAALREHPAANRVEVAGSARRWAETCKDIDLIATAEEPTALAEHLAAHPLIAAAGNPGANGVRAQTHNGVSVDLRIVAAGRLRQPAAALHRLQGPQRAAARRGGRPRPLGLRARDHRDRERRGRALRERGRASTSASATPTSSRSCARAAAS